MPSMEQSSFFADIITYMRLFPYTVLQRVFFIFNNLFFISYNLFCTIVS